MISLFLRTELALKGVRVEAPVSRSYGAGPTGDCHLSLDGIPTSLPLNNHSPFSISEGHLWLKGKDLGVQVVLSDRPYFYDEYTSDGIQMHKLARLHGKDVLATTVVQTCVRYVPSQRCKYCTIEESYNSGETTRVKTPQQLAEVAKTALVLDHVRQMVMTTGTSASSDRGARYLIRCVKAVKKAVPEIKIQIQCEPPDDLDLIGQLYKAGADAIGIHVESLDDQIRKKWLPGKAKIPLSTYWKAWDEAVKVFGSNQVSTYLLIGLGEKPEQIVADAKKLASRGVYPFVVPVRPGKGTLAYEEGLQQPKVSTVIDISSQVSNYLLDIGMDFTQQNAGCVSCGACSMLNVASKTNSRVQIKKPIKNLILR